jgi:hypothetical protein
MKIWLGFVPFQGSLLDKIGDPKIGFQQTVEFCEEDEN